MTLADIAVKHNVSVEYLKSQLAIGSQVEMDAGGDEDSAEQIARDNLVVNPHYYQILLGDEGK